jgi:hypothetical protein
MKLQLFDWISLIITFVGSIVTYFEGFFVERRHYNFGKISLFLLNFLITLAGFFVNVILFLLIKYVVFPHFKIVGIALFIIFFLRFLQPYLFKSIRKYAVGEDKNKLAKFYSISKSVNFVNSLFLGIILVISFYSTVKYSEIYHPKNELDSRISQITSLNSNIENSISVLNKNIEIIETSLRDTKVNINMLTDNLSGINTTLKDLMVERDKIQANIEDLKSKTTDKIEQETSYEILSKFLVQNTFFGILIGFLMSFLANIMYHKIDYFKEKNKELPKKMD